MKRFGVPPERAATSVPPIINLLSLMDATSSNDTTYRSQFLSFLLNATETSTIASRSIAIRGCQSKTVFFAYLGAQHVKNDFAF